MFKVVLFREENVAYEGTLKTFEEATEWAENHSSGIKEYTITDLENNPLDRKQKIKELKKKRDMILCATDWVFLPDVKIPQKHKKMYLTYRQLLRDIPQNLKDNKPVVFEKFDNWIRRNHPEEFLDGGKGQQIIYRFNYYIKE